MNECHKQLAMSILTYLPYFNGYLIRAIEKLKRHRFRRKSYSPSFLLIAECLTEATMVTSFPGQPMKLNISSITYIYHATFKLKPNNPIKNYFFFSGLYTYTPKNLFLIFGLLIR